MTILANGGRNLNDRGTSKGGNLESVQLRGVTATIQAENFGAGRRLFQTEREVYALTRLL